MTERRGIGGTDCDVDTAKRNASEPDAHARFRGSVRGELTAVLQVRVGETAVAVDGVAARVAPRMPPVVDTTGIAVAAVGAIGEDDDDGEEGAADGGARGNMLASEDDDGEGGAADDGPRGNVLASADGGVDA